MTYLKCDLLPKSGKNHTYGLRGGNETGGKLYKKPTTFTCIQRAYIVQYDERDKYPFIISDVEYTINVITTQPIR